MLPVGSFGSRAGCQCLMDCRADVNISTTAHVKFTWPWVTKELGSKMPFPYLTRNGKFGVLKLIFSVLELSW